MPTPADEPLVKCSGTFTRPLNLGVALTLLVATAAHAGGPKYVAGVSYFDPAHLGQPVIWGGGLVRYFVDQGPLGDQISNAQAVAMVDAAAQVWNVVPTAAVTLTDAGQLAEDVNGSNVVPGPGLSVSGLSFAAPADVSPSSTSTPVAVIFDSDGAVIDALEGDGASEPTNCEFNSVLSWIDNFNSNATFAHGVIVLNGRCASTASLQTMMSYQLERAFGSILGLDFSQINDNALDQTATEPNATLAWPIMQPINLLCGPAGGTCILNPGTLHWDDIAALNRLYPVTSANLGSFPGKQLTAANTVSIQGTIKFRSGQGMQGVNVVARPIDSSGNPLYQYTVAFVSGSYFAGNHGNPVTGWTDNQGNRFDRFGSNAAAFQGYFDLSGTPLPPGVSSANFQVSFEAVNPLYTNAISVGPYVLGSPTPSGTLVTTQVFNLTPGSTQTLNLTAVHSASDPHNGPTPVAPIRTKRVVGLSDIDPGSAPEPAPANESKPLPLPPTGQWTGRLSQVGQSDWFTLPIRGNRIFTIVAQALDETGTPSARKAMPAIGVWQGTSPIQTAAAEYTPAQDGIATGETWLQYATDNNGILRLGIADQRGDGRPDYLYRGWVLYADSVSPARLPPSGGPIVIRGTGFRTGNTVLVGGIRAKIVSILPTEITAVVSAAANGVTGSQDVEVDDLPGFNAATIIPGGLSYDSGVGDALSIITAPSGQVPLNVPEPFTILAKGPDGSPAGDITVTYALASGSATLGCGLAVCSVTTSGDGRATMLVTAISASVAVVTASLTNGASFQTQFNAGPPPTIASLYPALYLAPGASVQWPVQAFVQSGGSPSANQSVTWKSVIGIVAPSTTITDASGIASATLAVGPFAEGQTATTTACLTGTSTCANFTVLCARPEFASLAAISGTSQSLVLGSIPAPIRLRLLDLNGNSIAGGTIIISQALWAWSPPCPRRGRCDKSPLLSTQSSTAVSALDGSISFSPLTLPGVATNLQGVAVTGDTANLNFTVEIHP